VKTVETDLRMTPRYECDICGNVVEYEGRLPDLYPFCSDRCRRVDLYRWFSGQYAINRDLTPEELADLEHHPGRNPP
jgi:endogenous inhibitor of DNA gyrase (YacG/DUF329 family)